MSYDNLYHAKAGGDSPLYLSTPNFSRHEVDGACVRLPSGLVSAEIVDFLNDFSTAVESKAILIMRELVVGNPAIASEAYQYIPNLLQWLKQEKVESSSFEELGIILGALVTTYARNN